MTCEQCGGQTVSFSVPAEFREYAPDGAAVAVVCSRCLRLWPGSMADEPPAFDAVSDAMPADPEASAALVLAASLMGSLALNRSAIESLLERVEHAGVDPMLVFERVAADPEVDPVVDLDRRWRQLEQLRNP